ncbi:hypothetical protein [Acuticoccus kandeliae]|uniref:hypothetical protein n=1 Tax=Acuticoccus kandeliae TaxID=2073160 RepID=UPI000D3E1917|nr:hypothetical protein [Acuticoccus kandeliae]
MTDAYQKALARQAELKSEIADRDRELARINEFLKMYHELEGRPLKASAQVGRPTLTTHPRVLTREEAAPIIRKVLIDHQQPMTRAELLNALSEGGNPIGGREPANNLGTMMWRMKDQFVNLKGYGYWLADMAYEPAAYEPTVTSDEDGASADGASIAAEDHRQG